jgi:hypothetical protein
MPLDSSLKIAHIQSLYSSSKIYAGRQQTVVFVSLVSGVWTYTVQSVIFRRQDVFDPEQPDTSGAAPKLKADALMVVPISVDMTGVVYVAYTDTATAEAVAASERYEIIECTPTGIVPGGTRYICNLRRFR